MKLKVDIKVNLKDKDVINKVKRISENSLKNVVVDITRDAIHSSPKKTGHNARSIMLDIFGMEGSIYSTSGYGGYLETGTRRMPARPYFKPALDKNIYKLPAGIKAELR